MIKNLYKTFILTIALISGAAAAELSGSGTSLDGIVAVVNEGIVLKSELDAQVEVIAERVRESGEPMPPMDVLREQILERLIVNRIQLQRADRMGIRISDEVLNNALADVAGRNGIPFEALPQTLASQGIEYSLYRADMREQMAMDQLRQIDVFRRINVTERELEQCMAKSTESFGANAEFNLSHILVGVSAAATSAEFSASEEKADALYNQLTEGADFANMALTRSDSETSLNGGQLGWLKGNQIPTFFADTVRDLEDGEVSKPIRSGSGFHIIRLNETRGTTGRSQVNQTKVRHILVQANEVLDEAAAQQKLNDIRTRLLAGEDFSDLAKLNSDDPGSGNLGGDLGWTDPGTFVPEFNEVVERTDIDGISDVFRSRFGWHLLQVQGRRVHDNTEEVKRNECALNLRNARVGEETELWLRRLRDEAFVEKRI